MNNQRNRYLACFNIWFGIAYPQSSVFTSKHNSVIADAPPNLSFSTMYFYIAKHLKWYIHNGFILWIRYQCDFLSNERDWVYQIAISKQVFITRILLSDLKLYRNISSYIQPCILFDIKIRAFYEWMGGAHGKLAWILLRSNNQFTRTLNLVNIISSSLFCMAVRDTYIYVKINIVFVSPMSIAQSICYIIWPTFC